MVKGAISIRQVWKDAWSDKAFRYSFLAGIIVLAIIASLLPVFYARVEVRDGYRLHDMVLEYLTPRDLSVPIFMIIWGVVALGLYRGLRSPRIILNFLYAYTYFIITRSICLVFVPLDPPLGIRELVDPVTNIFYGGGFITKDLFYSGHTCSVFIMFLMLEKRTDKAIALLGSICLGMMLLFQHVHYTIDVLAAFVFGLICAFLGKLTLSKLNKKITKPVPSDT